MSRCPSSGTTQGIRHDDGSYPHNSEQYTFLAPSDYETNYADVLVPTGAQVTLARCTTASCGGKYYAKLDNSGSGVHGHHRQELEGLGLQVAGFGAATAYYYPGGLNLIHISAPPVIPVVK